MRHGLKITAVHATSNPRSLIEPTYPPAIPPHLKRRARGPLAKEKILRLDIPVDQPPRAKERQPGSELQHEVPRRSLRGGSSRLDVLAKVAAAAELKHD